MHALLVSIRVVVRGTTDNRHQRGELVRLELGKRPVEVKLGTKTEAVHGSHPILAEVDLVHVGVQQLLFVELELQDQGHGHFLELSFERLSIGQVVALHQLLSERAATLADLAAGQIHPGSSGNAYGIEAEMLVELSVLHGDQGTCEQLGHLFRRQHQPIFTMAREEVADVQRIKTNQRYWSAAAVFHADDAPIVELQPDPLAGPHGFRIFEGAQVYVQQMSTTCVSAWSGQVGICRVAEPR